MTSSAITLAKDTIDTHHIGSLIEWLQTNPKLTKGDLTIDFEKKWSEWLGVKYSVFLNSGSSANLAMIYSLILSKKLKNNKIIVPAVSWVTTITPAIQFGMEPIMCDCDENNLGLDIDHLKFLIKEHQPSCIILVHVLGIPNKMQEIIDLCKENDIYVLEDSCEALGSEYQGRKIGTLGDISSFSFYFGHHISTIEGGMACTNDEDLYHLLLSIRSHGWDRDLPEEKKQQLRKKYEVSDFRALYTFYNAGFNLRSTDLQAFIGIKQMDSIDEIINIRKNNFSLYEEYLKDSIWKIKPPQNSLVSNFAYPIITEKIEQLIFALKKNNIECRPLICGSMNEQPFWMDSFPQTYLPHAKKVHDFGLYLPNHHKLTKIEIKKITDVVNEVL